jgi:palmitoyltransferase ZDHHC13/17
MSSSSASTASRNSPAVPNGKASAAPPKLTDEGVELKAIQNESRPKLPIEEDLMQLARLGEIGAIQKLFEKGKYSATYRDEEGITALHVCVRLRVDESGGVWGRG